jgi:hypothetical protein
MKQTKHLASSCDVTFDEHRHQRATFGGGGSFTIIIAAESGAWNHWR